MTGNEKADLVRSVWDSIGRRDLDHLDPAGAFTEAGVELAKGDLDG